MGNDKVTVIMTCYNRKTKTENCIKSLMDCSYNMSFFITDDNSTDGTGEMLNEFCKMEGIRFEVIKGDGNLFWAGGMRKAIAATFQSGKLTDFYFLVNDDVEFDSQALFEMVRNAEKDTETVWVGATSNKMNQFTYGGVRKEYNGIGYMPVKIDDMNLECDTFNCNCVLIPRNILFKTGNFDEKYSHGLADFDYGFRLKKEGFNIHSTNYYVGICEKNKTQGTWEDTNLSIARRVKLKEMPKGLPIREWFHYLHKNYGLREAIIYSITPYIKIILRK